MENKLVNATENVPVQSPFCGSLRSKKFFMIDGIATSADQYLDASNHCWCRETQEVIGPDNKRVHPDNCVPGRSCYSSAI
ncbi:MAG: hypothetical protein C5B44_05215 [Acidobacteria bacterium]|nr:MAG: hypothetical protein C5B44_05215 [Acidobacteriota bacterium]